MVKDETMYCDNVESQKFYAKVILNSYSLLPLVLNGLIVYIFENIICFERNHTKTDETISLFNKIVIL